MFFLLPLILTPESKFPVAGGELLPSPSAPQEPGDG